MNKIIDCHSHSFYSPDGSESPDLLFKKASKASLEGLIITDHNTTSHFVSTKRAAKKYNMLTCEGIEITADFNGADIHILGYSNSFNKKLLEPLLTLIRGGYNDRSKIMLGKLKKAGINLKFSELIKKTKGGCVTKPLIAREISKIKNISQKEALSFVERGGIAYVPYGSWAPAPEEVVKIIKKAGGKAVFAHPGDFFGKRSSLPASEAEVLFEKLLSKLIKAGLSGMEVWYPTHTSKQTTQFLLITRKYKLTPTGGSDFHGIVFTPHLSVGQKATKVDLFYELIK